MKNQCFIAFILLFGSMSLASCNVKKASPDEVQKSTQKPNIIYILADDLGLGDLSCYGQTKFSTPNIDQLASNGMLFVNHYSGSTVCAPSRSSLMTGMHTGHTPIRGNREHKPEGQKPMPESSVTLAELLKTEGYATGAFGKWGLGYPGSEGDANNQGFDVFYGYNCQRMGHNYYPYHMWSNQTKVMLPKNEGKKTGVYAPELIHDQAISFIKNNKDKPFFMYYPSIIPHAELLITEEYMSKFRGKYIEDNPYDGCDDGPMYRIGGYGSQKETHAAFAAMITMLDDQVGDIVKTVKELGLEDNTIIVFTSDNGPHVEGGADPEFFDSNKQYTGVKRDLYEGGIRVPMVVQWKGKIAPGSTTEHVSAFWDVLPTFCEISGAKLPTNIDGISMIPTLLEKGTQKQHDYLYWEFPAVGGRKAIRKGDWKLVQYNLLNAKKEDKTMLFNLKEDPSEQNDLASANNKKVEELLQLMKEAHTPSKMFPFGEE